MRYIVVGDQVFPADVYIYRWYSCIDVSSRVYHVPFLLPGLESSLYRFYYCVASTFLSRLFIFHPAVDSCKTRSKGGGPAIQYTVATAKKTFLYGPTNAFLCLTFSDFKQCVVEFVMPISLRVLHNLSIYIFNIAYCKLKALTSILKNVLFLKPWATEHFIFRKLSL